LIRGKESEKEGYPIKACGRGKGTKDQGGLMNEGGAIYNILEGRITLEEEREGRTREGKGESNQL